MNESGNRKLVIAGGSVAALVVALGVVLWWGPWRSAEAEPAAKTTTTTTTAKPVTTTTAAPPPEVQTVPLTGMPITEEVAPLLGRPALAVKIDAAPAANPYVGLAQADFVIELRVEGISRYMAIFHSKTPESVGPVRSARTSDPDLLASLGHPLLATSGGNQHVVGMLNEINWIQLVSHETSPSDYFRTGDKAAPHNLLGRTQSLFDRANDQTTAPTPLVEYRSDADPVPGHPVAGLAASVGSDAVFAWDASAGWRRWAHGRPEMDSGGSQLAPTNVVVLQVAYRPSNADARSPEAISKGGGAAWVFSNGKMQEGLWGRAERTDPWTLKTIAGETMKLQPGTTWMVLADAPPTLLGTDVTSSLPPAG